MLEIAPKFEWVPVITRKGQPYLYPAERSLFPRELHFQAVIYRWVLRQPDGRCTFLVGETDDFLRRMGEYLGHKNKHHAKMRQEFDETLRAGGEVRLETLQFENFVINGVLYSTEKLYDPIVRAVLEGICCAQLKQQGFALLNWTIEKAWGRKLEKMTPEELAELKTNLEQVKAGFRQGTASAVPQKPEEEGGFSR